MACFYSAALAWFCSAVDTFDRSDDLGFGGAISGSGNLTKLRANKLTLTGDSSYTGTTTISGGTLQIGNGGVTGAITGDVLNNGTLAFNRGNNISFAGVISGSGNLTKLGAGTLILTGASSYGGATLVNAGSLIVNGTLIGTSQVTVNAGGTLGGNGAVRSTVVNGGTISPGNSPGTLTVNGNLTLGAGSIYLAEVQGAVADRITVTGTASLAGTLRLVPLGGAYSFNSPYTLLSAAGGISGTFSPVDTTGSFGAGVVATVDYTGNTVLLTLASRLLTPILGVHHSANAHAVASAIDGAVASGADVSPLFNLYDQPANALPAAVNQLSGEVHSGASALGFQAASQFLGSMLDPNGSGRLAGPSGGPGGAAGFTADLPSKRSAGSSSFDPARLSLWGTSFGSRGRYEGERSVGSANRTQDGAHLAVGADILLAPGTVAGVAVAGGRARASLSGGLGKVESDIFQAGLYGQTRIGPVSLGAAIGYARLDNDVQRAVPVLGNALTASYASTVWSGRLQASAQLLSWNGFSLSPLAALQAAQVRSPAFVERAGPGGNAGALSVAGRNDLTSRSELGVQFDGQPSLGAVPVTGFVRASWAHYFDRDASLTAGLIALPGASFSTSGARPDRNAALIAAGLDAKLSERVSLGLRLDSELSANTRSLGGTARLAVSF